jgi:beta-aspartyl-peptidase (threonine type)
MGQGSDLASALRAGWAILTRGGAAVDAVEAAVRVMEDSSHFNAGHGAAFNTEGEHELDASIMDGATLAAGAICGAKRIRNPVSAAKALMLRGDPLLLAGPAADDFAEHEGVDTVANAHFSTERRRKNLASMKLREIVGTAAEASEAEKHGTVGAVACDAQAILPRDLDRRLYQQAGRPRRRFPIIGAGTYARDGRCAVSGTGKGEYFMRYCVGHEIASLIAYVRASRWKRRRTPSSPNSPSTRSARARRRRCRWRDRRPRNTEGMYRGWVTEDGLIHVATHDHVELAGQA